LNTRKIIKKISTNGGIQMKKFLVLILVIFLISGTTASYAQLEHGDEHDHNHEACLDHSTEIHTDLDSESDAEFVTQSSIACPLCDMGSIYTSYKAPTCTQGGSRTHSCNRCYYESTQQLAPFGHDWGNLEVSCQITVGCSRCNATTSGRKHVYQGTYYDSTGRKYAKCVCGRTLTI